MRLFFSLVLTALMWSPFLPVNAQDLFSPFDCREHCEESEVFESDKGIATLAQLDISSQVFPMELPYNMDTTDGWKSWTFVENFAFGKDRGDMPMITDLNALHPYFRDRIINLVEMCRAKGIEITIVESYRTHAKQHEYQNMGRQYTNSGAGKSKHQYGLAIDVVPVVDGVAVWDNVALWKKVGVMGETLGLRWGGRWKKPYDPGHFEWTGGISTAELYRGTFPIIPAVDQHYPCLEEDVRILRKYWNEWEISQSSLTRK